MNDAELRRCVLIKAAERVFLRHGYHAATMDDVAGAAGMSKRTLYQLVQSKEELFTALLARHNEPFDFSIHTEGRTPEDVLFDVLARWAHHVLSPSTVSLLRLIMAEYIHGRTLSRLLDRESAKPCKDVLQGFLAGCAAAGTLDVRDPEEAAQMLYGMAIGKIHMQMLLGIGKTPSRVELEARIRRAICLFLRGTLPRHAGGCGRSAIRETLP
ncbi:TetR/AcrR family transcriptional regulator [Acidiphilium sp. AL]|uniref:TetR/AcrR family transcriptional regulator n=1 Tax=Acidiphilium iwatense TaxID=768198 RepID=A0ABS9DVQ7_9PROT|nr:MULTISPECIES: TetR/AcrR family transcriptional regulator [Acidiphilium]MCF3946813.1 TetR/AcrR family transcriptional regulator [Acidiphilium iwatense]MCU4160842.1 TetR/AcrR family transcriptional regulator [Acidiphilium sp. AL]